MSAGLPQVLAPSAAVRPERLELDDPRWTAFVSAHPNATPFHLPGWVSAVAHCYRFRAFVLGGVSADGRLVAGVPVVEVRPPWRRAAAAAKWIALPFTDYCPLLASDPANAQGWLAAARTAAAGSGVRTLKLRAGVPGEDQSLVGVRHVLALNANADDVYRGFSRSQVQRNIKRADREGVVVRSARERSDLTDIFYRLHLATRRRQGVPVQPHRFFGLVWDEVVAPGHGTVLVAEHGGRPLAAAVFLRHNGTVIYKFGASDADAWSLRPNHALFWQAIQDACAAGDSEFDWGRTDLDNEGLRSFKSTWGAAELPLCYTTVLPANGAAPAERDLAGSRAARMLATGIQHAPPWVCAAVGTALYRFTA